jgi:hypothetical protein
MKNTIIKAKGTICGGTGEETTDIELIMKYCSKLNKLFGWPYFFNWSTSTNHTDESPDGEIRDISYAVFRVGKYEEDPNHGNLPVEKQIIFGPIRLIVVQNAGLKMLAEPPDIDGVVIDKYVEANIDVFKQGIDRFLRRRG